MSRSDMANSYSDWITETIVNDCTMTGLSLEDPQVRKAIVEGLSQAAAFFDELDRPSEKNYSNNSGEE